MFSSSVLPATPPTSARVSGPDRGSATGSASDTSFDAQGLEPRKQADGPALTCLERLRRETQASHMATETLFAAFLDAPERHLDFFLLTHLLAFEALQSARIGAPLSEEANCLPDMIARLRADCARRGRPAPAAPRLAPLPSEAVAYLVIGSRLGTEVIRRKLLKVAPEAGLPSYFVPHDTGPAWQSLRARLSAIPGDSPLADQICSGALRGFDAFALAADLLRSRTADWTGDLSGQQPSYPQTPATQES